MADLKRKIIDILLNQSNEPKNKNTADIKSEDWLWSGDFETVATEIMCLTDWKYVSDMTPPSDTVLLAKSPSDIIHLTFWRETYNIFNVQNKLEDSSDWKWKLL